MTLGATRVLRRLGGAGMVLIAVGCGAVILAPPARADSNVDEGQFLVALNNVRAQRGLPPLAPDGQLVTVARAWSSHMASDGAISHNPALASQVTDWRTLGENVGTGSSVASIEAALEASPHHFENMVDPAYRYVGIGVVEVGATIWVTEDFKQSKSGLPSAAVPAAAPAPRPAPRPAPVPRPAPAAAPRPATARPGSPAQPAPVPAAVEAARTSDPGSGAAPASGAPGPAPGSAGSHGGSSAAARAAQLTASRHQPVNAGVVGLALFAAVCAGVGLMLARRRLV